MTDALTQAAEEQVDKVLRRCYDEMNLQGLSDKEAAEICVLSIAQIRGWRSGYYRPTSVSLFKFAYGMGVPTC